jgi:cytochrome c-type biogenesis protein CcmH/NrfF
MNESYSKKELEKCLLRSQKAVTAHVITLIVTLLIALGIKLAWDPRWWIYVLILWVGPYGLVGDGINIWYCKKKLKNIVKSELTKEPHDVKRN